MNDETTEQLRTRYAASLEYPNRTLDYPWYAVDLGATWGLLDERGTIWTLSTVRTYEDALRLAIDENTWVDPHDIEDGRRAMAMTERDAIAHEWTARDSAVAPDDLPW